MTGLTSTPPIAASQVVGGAAAQTQLLASSGKMSV